MEELQNVFTTIGTPVGVPTIGGINSTTPVATTMWIARPDGTRLEDNLNKLEDVIVESNAVTPITYSELVDLKSQTKLQPGHYYRITDYITTSTATDSKVMWDSTIPEGLNAGFDIIVQAINDRQFSEYAYTAVHASESYSASATVDPSPYTYINSNPLYIKYCIDNDTTRFAWADKTNGKGVIYYMYDPYYNIEMPYDFKHITFQYYNITGSSDTNMEMHVSYTKLTMTSRFDTIELNNGYNPHLTSTASGKYYYPIGGENELSTTKNNSIINIHIKPTYNESTQILDKNIFLNGSQNINLGTGCIGNIIYSSSFIEFVHNCSYNYVKVIWKLAYVPEMQVLPYVGHHSLEWCQNAGVPSSTVHGPA